MSYIVFTQIKTSVCVYEKVREYPLLTPYESRVISHENIRPQTIKGIQT